MRDYTTSGLAKAILKIGLRSTPRSVGDELFALSDLENVGLAVGITVGEPPGTGVRKILSARSQILGVQPVVI